MRTGLFLTPGAARAAYQVGVVQELVRSGVRFDVVAASSVGALNGAFVATGQVDRLAQLWAGWRTADIAGIDWAELARGAVVRARNLMHNRPQKKAVIDRYLSAAQLEEGVRLRFNLANLTTGGQEVVEWPPGPMPLTEGVNASVAVPAAIRPVDAGGAQLADGLTVDGFPLEALLLATEIDRAFVVGVAPRSPIDRPARTPYAVLLRSLEWNQYSETVRGLDRAAQVDEVLRCWQDDRAAVEQVVAALPVEEGDRARLLAEVERAYAGSGFPWTRRRVEILPILPAREIPMFFTDYRPSRSRELLEQGRRDARAALEELAP
jgi:NTE family protein